MYMKPQHIIQTDFQLVVDGFGTKHELSEHFDVSIDVIYCVH